MESDYYRHIRNRCVINDSGFYAEILMRVLPHTHECKYAMNVLKGGNILAKKECTDHLGNIYASVVDMCRFYKLTPNTYRQRIKSGWSVERALTESTDRYSCKDHLGRNYDSETKMCAFYGIDYKMYWARIHNMGWSVKDALTLPIRDDSIHDFNGMQFNKP